ncbi:hypothetical protein [Trichormus azollae]|mgnify:FL=1|jgi:hypothetical protein|uniref:Uncharacterized protein n=1 Tax=Nostoc azollae (strain 0708) TaxID=551115 RepID=D7DYL8_NOSA0|nr:hypothetical protein [Trichormus azollae]ADI62841.1 hypothetical protein Aazo_0219 ['Nostoc azollae' 0708]
MMTFFSRLVLQLNVLNVDFLYTLDRMLPKNSGVRIQESECLRNLLIIKQPSAVSLKKLTADGCLRSVRLGIS